jgi:hypothetical protein
VLGGALLYGNYAHLLSNGSDRGGSTTHFTLSLLYNYNKSNTTTTQKIKSKGFNEIALEENDTTRLLRTNTKRGKK